VHHRFIGPYLGGEEDKEEHTALRTVPIHHLASLLDGEIQRSNALLLIFRERLWGERRGEEGERRGEKEMEGGGREEGG
jgi:hypothetical protein